MFIGPWHQQYPDAKVIGPEGLLEKRDKQGNEKVPFSVIFKDSEKEKTRVGPEFDAEFDYEYVPSHANKEIVFNYKPDKTLIEGDLLFNLPATEQFSKAGESAETGLPTKLANYIQSTTGPATAQARFVYYALSSKDRTGFGRSISRIENWDFDRIIPCHGDVIETGGKGIFQKVMQLMPRPGTTAPTATTS